MQEGNNCVEWTSVKDPTMTLTMQLYAPIAATAESKFLSLHFLDYPDVTKE